ncbi:alpha/beta hydrolase [Paenibacillus pini]|uniref:Carboxymethylenebutenolidase n=1 Tax=Paenibacillus pini JCM 16418 TaxID=1236976 RepID=W7YEL0_9BACL|nr:alpha/beta hydrolase [Paenibacillus pini]GAF09375.1 carboxymethylenebutenolidase [Paenibacillus pini JCM 16418]
MNEGQHLIRSKPKRKIGKWILISFASLIMLLVLGLLIAYPILKYEPLEQAKQAMESNSALVVKTEDNSLLFEPADKKVIQPSLIFYPGALVDAESYAPLARKVAEAGHRVYIVKMPFDLAIFGKNRANPLIQSHPDDTFVIGGHSLGGAFAARYAAANTSKLAGVFFLGSYADEGGSLKNSGLDVLQVTGSKDGVLNWKVWEESKQNLPADTTKYVSIEGGNHGQFGTYGKQKGDQDATISSQQQLDEVSQAIIEWMRTLKK